MENSVHSQFWHLNFFTKTWCFFSFPPSIHKAKQTNQWLFASLPTTLAAPSTSPNTSLTSQERLMPSDLCWSIPATRFPRMGFKILAFKTKLLKHHTSWGMQKCGNMEESGNIHNCGCMHFWWRRLSEVCTGFYHQTDEKVLVMIGISAGAGA